MPTTPSTMFEKVAEPNNEGQVNPSFEPDHETSASEKPQGQDHDRSPEPGLGEGPNFVEVDLRSPEALDGAPADSNGAAATAQATSRLPAETKSSLMSKLNHWTSSVNSGDKKTAKKLRNGSLDSIGLKVMPGINDQISSNQNPSSSSSNGDDRNSKNSAVDENSQNVKMPGSEESLSQKLNSTPEKRINHLPFHKLFKFSSAKEKVLIVLGILGAICGGCTLPVMIILFGNLANTFVTNDFDVNSLCQHAPDCCTNGTFVSNKTTYCSLITNALEVEGDDFSTGIAIFGGSTAIIGLINFVMSYIFVTCLNYSAECQVYRIRQLFFKAILRQDIGWYDTNQTGDFASKMTEDLNKLQEGIGEKVGMFIFFMTIFTASIINAFTHGWELTLVMFSGMPILVLATGIIAKSQTLLAEKEMAAYGKAGSIAEEVLSSIRTVVAFGGEHKEVERFKSNLVFAKKAGIMRGVMTGVGGGLMWLIIFSSYALAFWYGVKLIMDDRQHCIEDAQDCHIRYDPSSLLVVFFSVLIGAMNIGQASPYVEAFSLARGSATTIFDIIDRIPAIDSLNEGGDKPISTSGQIVFKDVHFNYPSRPDVKILDGLCLTITKGQTVALVGPSGCGKSTVIHLVQRFYDPLKGSIEVGEKDIKDLNLKWLRDKIGVVGQEPVLFDCTIKENIKQGREGVSDKEIEQACEEANALGFIGKLPKKLNTLVGERGSQLSGGQKQRIAIARALVRNPEILLLDEATSALDTHSESLVQTALDKARSGRTTIVVAHRLSTVRTADMIFAMKDGKVAESGNHDELMKAKGLYFNLVQAQSRRTEDDDEDEDDSEDSTEEEGTQNLNNNMEDFTVTMVPDEFPSLSSQVSGVSSILANVRRMSMTVERKISVTSILSDESVTYREEDLGVVRGGSDFSGSKYGSGIARKRGVTSMERQISQVEEPKEEPSKVSLLRVLMLNMKEWPFLLVGLLSACIIGGAMPVYAILFGEVLGLLAHTIDKAREESVYFAILFLVVGIVVGAAMFIQIAMFTLAGEQMTMRVRKRTFEAMLRQDVGWFDRASNSTGALCSRLAADAGAVQGAAGSRTFAIFIPVFTILLTIGFAIYHEWRLGLVGSLFVPFAFIGGAAHAKIVASHDNLEKEGLEKSATMAVEAISNIRTVASLCKEQAFLEKYTDALTRPHHAAKKKSHLRGAVFGFAQSTPFFAYAACMYYGGYLVETQGMPFKICFKVAEALILGTMVVGQATAFAPNYAKSVMSASRIFTVLDRKPAIISSSEDGLSLDKVNGDIALTKTAFNYPTRPTTKVLRDINLAFKGGQSVAFVGSSGCGKSTCIQLLQRFYNPLSGSITLDKNELSSMNLPWLRRTMGIVSQEPVLFDRTIAENIQYGDNTREVSMDEVVEASKKANIHSFISSLPQGYDTRVGGKGTQLSGGQKQRVAIARALVRNPTILLLDEATSALDTESEKVVQEALDSAKEGRTSVTIAHRLSTVQYADVIFVLSHGKVIEQGTHTELLNRQGMYFRLWSKQAGCQIGPAR